MRVVQGCVLIVVSVVITALNLASAAHSTPINAPMKWRRPYPLHPLHEDGIVEYSERRAERFSMGSARQYPLKDSGYVVSATDFPDIARDRHSLASALGTRHSGPSQLTQGFLDPLRRFSSVELTAVPEAVLKEDLCWRFPAVCSASTKQIGLHLSPVHTEGGENTLGRRPQVTQQGDRPRPVKRYLGIELPDYIATKHTSLRATNSHYLARINQLKQRMRHVGK
ncbi:uncharacterized protein LOC122251783 [Penaeus japonicus]|uniref:uncharacterized protein LOC122251783 n=1 Tax=Penaeus japonicus TaxID=27405 RepID=UPI001C711B8A|nr:uncharacterized protein LOC122251783 [Penaeus japonicus]